VSGISFCIASGHTFMTRRESGCDVWTLDRTAGHASIKVSSHYVHSSQNAAEAAILRLPVPSQQVGTNLGTSRMVKTQSIQSSRRFVAKTMTSEPLPLVRKLLLIMELR
jgi:hypothetical protein